MEDSLIYQISPLVKYRQHQNQTCDKWDLILHTRGRIWSWRNKVLQSYN